jgi:acyl-CoA reductase-like NAD-dependent aldehyde dehydrogenase
MLEVLKTVKMYSGGAFIRSESGRTFAFMNKNSEVEYARVCQGSKKDLRNSIVSAKGAIKGWSSKTAYNRSQILYRMAEMMQGKSSEFCELLVTTLSMSEKDAKLSVEQAIDTFVYYAGWCDKYQQVMGSVNPVAAPYHNFTTPENMGVITLVDSDKFSLPKLIDNICAIIVGGNTVVALVSKECPAVVTILGEVFATSDLPGGVVNLLTGYLDELKDQFATHMEINGVSFQNENEDTYFEIRSASIDNMKRIIPFKKKSKSLDLILDFVETKTVWHPIGY